MEEWNQQVMTIGQNMQHKSAHLQEELHESHGQVSMENHSNSKLKFIFYNLFQGYEQSDSKLKTLSQVLNQGQYNIGCFKVPRNLWKNPMDNYQGELSVARQSREIIKHTSSSDQNQKLEHEYEQLKNLLQEKDATIRSRQENKKRLSDSIAIASGLDIKEKEETASEGKQINEKREVLQKSLREDHLIKSRYVGFNE